MKKTIKASTIAKVTFLSDTKNALSENMQAFATIINKYACLSIGAIGDVCILCLVVLISILRCKPPFGLLLNQSKESHLKI